MNEQHAKKYRAAGTVLRTYRAARRLSQEELAARADLTRETISNIEAGKCRPSRKSIRNLAFALDVAPSALEGDGE